jgi:hypothetical protein
LFKQTDIGLLIVNDQNVGVENVGRNVAGTHVQRCRASDCKRVSSFLTTA